MDKIVISIIKSWSSEEGNVNSISDIMDWINYLNYNTQVNINECSIHDNEFWFYDDYNGEILNRKRSFFSIKGMRLFENRQFLKEQPIIIQPEIGYLGVICKIIDGVLNFLMQAKIEPGNVNSIQISPTIQATKSNFTRAHGGMFPTYFEYFENSKKYHVLYDQIQSEQAARFYRKRNRNMIMLINEDIDIFPNFKWMTLGQIKKLMEMDNLINMDTRTVFSGIPFVTSNLSRTELKEIKSFFNDKTLFTSIFDCAKEIVLPTIYQTINNYKMFNDIQVTTIPLNQLVDWDIDEYGITCKKKADFMVRYYNIEISGREIRYWSQPLFKAVGMATFGLITAEMNGMKKILVKMRPEIGSFDKVEIGPSIQWEASYNFDMEDKIEKLFTKYIDRIEGILTDVILSEEGGRFYHEQNRNVIVNIPQDEIGELPVGYVWADFGTLNYLVQVNNCLNIQLRNLLSLIKL